MLRVRSSLDRTLICKLRFPVQIAVDWNSHFSLQMKRMDAESKKLKAEVRQLSARVDSRHSAIYYFSHHRFCNSKLESPVPRTS
jgi:hypothetical protein